MNGGLQGAMEPEILQDIACTHYISWRFNESETYILHMNDKVSLEIK